jgi:hypothetical protein
MGIGDRIADLGGPAARLGVGDGIPNLATTMDAQAGKAGLREVESPSPDPGRQEGKKLQTARFQDDPGRRLRASRSRPGMPRSASECLGVPEADLRD